MTEVWKKLINANVNDKGCDLTFDDVAVLVYYINKLEVQRNKLNHNNKILKQENETLKDQIKNYYEQQLRGDEM